MNLRRELENLQEVVIQCHRCPRLVAYLKEVSRYKPKRFRDWDYWGKPLSSFGDPNARVLVIGLAPAANGGNRTGRMFTGDRSGEWLFGALHQFGFANQPNSVRRDDDFALDDCYITATIRCAPPDNKPLPEEIENCRPYFLKELDLLSNVKVLLSLGQIAFTQTLKSLRIKGLEIPPLSFGHGKIYSLRTPYSVGNADLPARPAPVPTEGGAGGRSLRTLIASYHPSQQNTLTGRLTRPMFHKVFRMARRRL